MKWYAFWCYDTKKDVESVGIGNKEFLQTVMNGSKQLTRILSVVVWEEEMDELNWMEDEEFEEEIYKLKNNNPILVQYPQ